MNNRIIINADDCGKSVLVDAEIEKCINLNCISSTTVMANMNDLVGAKQMYEKYKEKISFGMHFNLSEGQPILNSQCLLDMGYYKEEDGIVNMCGGNFRLKIFSRQEQDELFKELDAQIQVLLDNGFEISHIDSHRHIHYSYTILPVFVRIAEKYHINKIRIKKNYLPFSLRLLAGKLWKIELDLLNRKFVTTDYFSGFSNYYRLISKHILLKDNSSIEFMVHPGHPKYLDEIELLKEKKNIILHNNTLINYNEL